MQAQQEAKEGVAREAGEKAVKKIKATEMSPIKKYSILKERIWEVQRILDSKRSLRKTNKSVSTTPQMTCYRGAKVCSKWLQVRIDDHNIQPDNKFTIGLKVRLQNWL